MKILHCCFSGGYTENCAYQENMLTELHRRHGHEVLVAASDETVRGGAYSRCGAGELVTEDGIRVIRLEPSARIPSRLRYNLRFFPGFARIMEDFGPDVIFFHSAAAHELLTAARYKRAHPGTALLADSHAALTNSAKNVLSREVLHKGYYRSIYNRVRGDLDAFYYIGIGERDYLVDILGAEPEDISFLPLGGLIADGRERSEKRALIRKRMGVSDDDILLCYSGKIDGQKRPEMILGAMGLCTDPRLRLVIVGAAQGEYLDMITSAAENDPRVSYTGWQSAETLRDYLCASDAYVLPGGASATVQAAICCGTPVLSFRHYTYTEQFGDNNGMLYFESTEQLAELIRDITEGRTELGALRREAENYARENLDYERQAYLIESFGIR